MDTFLASFPEGAGAPAPASARSGEAPALRGANAPAAKESAPAAADSPPRTSRAEQLRLANQHLARFDSRLEFRMDEASGRMVVAVVNRDTSEVLRQIPSEEMLAISLRLEAQLQELNAGTGLLFADEV